MHNHDFQRRSTSYSSPVVRCLFLYFESSHDWLHFPAIHNTQAQYTLSGSGKQTSEGSLRLKSKPNKKIDTMTEYFDIHNGHKSSKTIYWKGQIPKEGTEGIFPTFERILNSEITGVSQLARWLLRYFHNYVWCVESAADV